MDEYKKHLEDEHFLESLAKAKLAKLTPRVKASLIKVGTNQYTLPIKQAEHVVWRIVSKKDNDGKEAFYLARIQSEVESAKKVAADLGVNPGQENAPQNTEILIDTIELAHEAVSITPTNCPGKGKVQDLLINDAGKPSCMLQGKKCSHLHDFSVTVLAGDKTINCDIKVQ